MHPSEKTDMMNIYILIATATTLAVAARVCKRATKLQRGKRKHDSLLPGRLPNSPIGREPAGRKLKECFFFYSNEYTHETASHGFVFNKAKFERRFWMPRAVYNRVRQGVLQTDKFFQEGKECIRIEFSTTNQKIVATIWQLIFRVSADGLAGTPRISESLIHGCRRRFTLAVVSCFGKEYLRRPIIEDANQTPETHAKIGFPRCFESLDCSG